MPLDATAFLDDVAGKQPQVKPPPTQTVLPPSSAPAPPHAAPVAAPARPPAPVAGFNAGAFMQDVSANQLPKPPSALGAIGDVLDLPFVAGGALTRGGAGIGGTRAPYSNVDEFKKMAQQIQRFGVRGLEDVNRRYGLFAPEQLQDMAQHGDPIAGWFATNPKAGPIPLTAVADFIAEFGNPSNVLVPAALRQVGRAGSAAARALPGPAQAVARTIEGEVAPYGGLRRADPSRPSTPGQREASGRYYQSAKQRADEAAHAMLEPIFKDTTREQRIEFERRSENLGPRGVVNPPKPVADTDDAFLDTKAQQFRGALRQLDKQQLAWGSLPKDRMLLSSEYTPRYGGGHNGVYIDPNAPPGSPLAEYMESERPPLPGQGRTFKRGTGGQGIHKTYLTHDEAAATGKLSPEYDPATAMAAHFRQRLTNNELVKSSMQFRRAGLMQPLEYKMPFDVGRMKAGTTVGMGPEGHTQMAKWMGRAARPITRNETSAALGLPPTTRMPRRVAVAPTAARAMEAGRAAREAGRSSLEIGAARGEEDSKRIMKAADFIHGQGSRASQRSGQLVAKYQNARFTDAQARVFHTKFNELFPGIKSRLVEQGERHAEGAAHAEGNLAGHLTQQFGTAGAHMAYKPELDAFLRQQGVPRQDATGMAKFIDDMNALTRLGIIANPFVHILWNLNTQFMGAGGHLGEIAAKVWNPKWMPDEKWLTRAEADGAIPHFSPQFDSIVGKLGYGKLTGAASDLNPIERGQQAATKLWDFNQEMVFGTMEKRYATLLYQKFVEGGMEGKEAGIAVRKALGDYANVSRQGIEASLNKALFFYPWLKTVVPFWMGQLATHPQRVDAPMQAIRTSNEATGDPNLDRQRPFSIHTGEWGGQSHYFSAPVPIRYLDDLMSIVAPQGDLGGGMTERTAGAMRVAESHANPAIATGLETMNTVLSPSEEPGGAALYTLWDKAAPPEVQAGQLATSLTTKALPLPLQIRQAIEFLRELPRTPHAGEDALAGSVAGTLGGTTYGRPSAGVQAALKTMRGTMVRLVGEARKAGNEQGASDVYHAYMDAIHSTERNAGQ